jgi:hypothetical protein
LNELTQSFPTQKSHRRLHYPAAQAAYKGELEQTYPY